ncbi:MAG: 50S ribosomal protein L3 [Elusimicrobiota bacterium]|jgi:large subunit ribosomal protein L3|nr:50S ribosomal protein L3 [Elusimicrobiota bacterium]
MLKSIIAKKLGMTQIFDDKGNLIPVTALEAGPCVVVGIKTADTDGYNALLLGFADAKEKQLNKAQIGIFKKANLPAKKILKEFKVSDGKPYSIGQEIKTDLFKAGDFVDVTGITKGKGFAGVIKRHNFGMQPTTHGQSDRTRARGSSGGQGPQRVLRGMRMSGHLGQEKATIQKLKVISVDADKNLIFIKGALPSANGGVLTISKTVKRVKAAPQPAAKQTKGKKK